TYSVAKIAVAACSRKSNAKPRFSRIDSMDSRIAQQTLTTIRTASAASNSHVTRLRGPSSSKIVAKCRRRLWWLSLATLPLPPNGETLAAPCEAFLRIGPLRRTRPQAFGRLGEKPALEPGQEVSRREVFPRSVRAPLEFDLAFGKSLRPDHDLPGNTDEVAGREFGTGPLVGVVVENVDALGHEIGVELFACAVDSGIALLEVEDRGTERRHRFRPFDTGIVMAGFDDRADEARDADAVGAAMDRHLDAVGAGNHRLHRVGIFGAEIEDLADLDAAGMHPLVRRYLGLEARGFVN